MVMIVPTVDGNTVWDRLVVLIVTSLARCSSRDIGPASPDPPLTPPARRQLLSALHMTLVALRR